VSDAPATEPGPPEKGVADILQEALAFYRKHASALLLTCAVLFVPASIVKSCALAAITGPVVAAELSAERMNDLRGHELDEARQRLQDAYQRHADKGTIAERQADVERISKELERLAATLMGGFTVMILGFLGKFLTVLIVHGVVVSLTNGALTIAVADRLIGGQVGWREAWTWLVGRAPQLLSAVIPAALLVAFGYVFFFIPGVVLALLFAFVAPVVLLEGRRGRAALQRSAELTGSDWLRVVLLVIAIAVLRWLAEVVAGILVPRSAIFLGSLVSDLLTMAVLPLPVIGLVLLYLDVRRRRDGFTDDRLRTALEALKTG
jgi:hypothetical protein